jgi:hypothetical protein
LKSLFTSGKNPDFQLFLDSEEAGLGPLTFNQALKSRKS